MANSLIMYRTSHDKEHLMAEPCLLCGSGLRHVAEKNFLMTSLAPLSSLTPFFQYRQENSMPAKTRNQAQDPEVTPLTQNPEEKYTPRNQDPEEKHKDQDPEQKYHVRTKTQNSVTMSHPKTKTQKANTTTLYNSQTQTSTPQTRHWQS